MTRHYSTKDFFRQMPNALLAGYFQARGLFEDLDFTTLKETQPEPLFAAWLDLPDSQRNEMDAEFRDIFELGCEKGFRAIIDEAEWHLATDPAVRTAPAVFRSRSIQRFDAPGLEVRAGGIVPVGIHRGAGLPGCHLGRTIPAPLHAERS